MARGAAARATVPAPRRAPQRPARPRRQPTAVPTRRPARPRTVPERLAAIPHSPFVDRLLTGRAWIVLVAALLAGIVFANVALLELNAGIAQTTERVAALKRENSRLRLQAARLGSSERIQRAAADIGLVLPAPGEVRYLKTRPARDAALAVSRMSAPAPIPVYVPPPVAPVAEPVVAPVEPAPAPVDPVTGAPAPVEPAPVAPAPDPMAAAPATPPATTGETG
ncbi:MAG: hypothetical protein QOJ22_239 [Thermoleophilaceae bacterium]|jgi:cell division protein FtsL|nr:hypothetical protein [Thermoleophilaceae bacterium]